MVAKTATRLGELLEQTVPAMGFELVDWELGASGLVRVFIDKPAGIDVEDCAAVSHQLTRLFAVEEVDFGRLEVSSPGLDRPLRKASDYTRFAGQEAKFTLREPLGGSASVPIDKTRKLKGTLRGVDGEAAVVETTAGMRTIPFDLIERARLIPRIEWRKS
jgi:ribosome maturation factor RimP